MAVAPRAKEAQGRCLKGKLSQACSCHLRGTGGTLVEDLQGGRECTTPEGPSEAASWRAPFCEPWVTWLQGWGSEVTTVTKCLALPPLFPSSCPRHPPPPTTSTSLKHSLSGITLSAVFISWEGCNKSPQMGELQQKSPPSDSGDQSLKPGGSQGRAPSRGSKGGFYLSLPALGGSRHPWLVATSLPSLPPS